MHIGLKYPVFAPFATEPDNALPTYGAGAVVAELMEANEAIEYNDASVYANDAQTENDKSFKKGKLTVNIDDLTQAIKKLWFGMADVVLNGAAGIGDAVIYESPYGGFGYYRVRRKKGVRKIEAHWYYKTKWTRPNNEAKTKGETVEFQTPKCEGEIIACGDVNGSWHFEVEFNTETEAQNWLKGMAGIVTPDVLALSSSTPADDAVNASKTAAIVLTFNNVMNQNHTVAICAKATDGSAIALTPAWDSTGKILTLTHAALAGATAHILTYRGVDTYGQALEGTIFFTTVA